MTISDDLTWNEHILNITKNGSTRLYYITVLKHCRVPVLHMHNTYLSRIHPILEYACQAWHPALTKELSNFLEHVQKWAIHIILRELSYNEALESLKLKYLTDRRTHLCKRYFAKIQHPDHKLHNLLPEPRNVAYNLRHVVNDQPPKLRTLRASSSLVNWALYNLQ